MYKKAIFFLIKVHLMCYIIQYIFTCQKLLSYFIQFNCIPNHNKCSLKALQRYNPMFKPIRIQLNVIQS